MKKNLFPLALFLVLAPGYLFAQCCNVLASNGTAVVSSGGSCVSLTGGASDCLTVAVIAPASDIDGDGISDDNDKCPELKGLAADNGCPVVMVEVWTLFYSEMKDVKFAYNSDSLTATSFSKLDNIARLMNENKQYSLKVSGYADSVGTETYNKELSVKRAEAVKSYLVSKGVQESKVKVASYGEKFPKVPNETEADRAKNRRVEFDLFY